MIEERRLQRGELPQVRGPTMPADFAIKIALLGHGRCVRASLLAVVIAVGCGDNRLRAPDAAVGSAADALPDVPMVDAAVDAPPVACPNRTAPPGMPQDMIPPEATIVGNFTITTQADIDALANIRYITGDLVIGNAVDNVTLPSLEVIGGRCVGGALLIHLPRLETVGGPVEVGVGDYQHEMWDSPRLEDLGAGIEMSSGQFDLSCLRRTTYVSLSNATSDVVLPKLETATQGFGLGYGSSTKFLCPELTTSTSIQFIGTPDLTVLSAPKLVGWSSLTLWAATNLQSVTLGLSGPDVSLVKLSGVGIENLDFLASATHVAIFEVGDVFALQSIGLPPTTQVDYVDIGGAPLVSDLSALSNSRVTGSLIIVDTGATTISMPNVVDVGVLNIENNPNLTTLALPNLTAIDATYAMYITGNTALPNCQATTIRDHVTLSPFGSLTVSDNKPDTCQ
jgi:hypothetical protein